MQETTALQNTQTKTVKSYTGTEERILNLLGSGVAAEQVAAAVGVSASYVSQLLSTDEFSAAVSELRYKSLQKHNERDSSLDSLEDKILEKMHQSLPLVMRPLELTRMLQVVNAAKRRGTSAPDSILQKQEVVTLTLPPVIINKFTTNIQNQVVQAGHQELVTMQSGTLLEKLKNGQHGRDLKTLPIINAKPESQTEKLS